MKIETQQNYYLFNILNKYIAKNLNAQNNLSILGAGK